MYTEIQLNKDSKFLFNKKIFKIEKKIQVASREGRIGM